MAIGLVLPLRIAQFLFGIIVAGLAGYVFHWYDVDTLTNPPTQINFLIAVPVFSFLSILYLEIAPRFVPKVSHPYVHLAFESLNTVFYFSGCIALAAFLGRLLFCRGKVCAAARATAVFAGLTFVLWAVTTTLLCLEIFRGGVEGVKTDKKATEAMKAEREAAQMGNIKKQEV